ncbi:MAG: cyclic pyranopterin monophosphate synthase MoaC [Chloroflexota bacterium]|nr:cyclic pyranopterin monophosphate synthase MoaC [Chloroflexota bacterium]
MASERGGESNLTHLDAQGQARMVDVGAKPDTERSATAEGAVTMRPEILALIESGGVEKGDVFTVARVAGIAAAKKTWDIIPLAHQLPLNHVSVEFAADAASGTLTIRATAKTTAKTGVEMEALTAACAAALTVYDMCKAVDRGMRLGPFRLVEKRGGASGDYAAE